MMSTLILPMYIGIYHNTVSLGLCPTFLYLFCSLYTYVIVWNIVRGTAASSAPVPMPMLPDVGICCNTLGCMIHAQLMLHCVTLFLVSVLFVPSLHLHYFCRNFLIFLVSVLFMEPELGIRLVF